MAYYNKIGILIMNELGDKFLVCEKDLTNVTADYIMPGGQFTEDTVEECIVNEMREELSVEVNLDNLTLIGEYTDVAAGKPDRDVCIKLYTGVKLLNEPVPSTEIKAIHWIGKNNLENKRISPIVRNKILPDLINRSILL